METGVIYFFLGVIGIINLICYWVLCSNVGKLTRTLAKNQDYYRNEYAKQLTFGDKEAAREALKELAWLKFVEEKGQLMSEQLRERTLKQIHNEFATKFEKADMKLPEVPVWYS